MTREEAERKQRWPTGEIMRAHADYANKGIGFIRTHPDGRIEYLPEHEITVYAGPAFAGWMDHRRRIAKIEVEQ